MKLFLFSLTALALSSAANAGFAPTTRCSNLDATISFEMGSAEISILTGRNPEDTYEKIAKDDLNITMDLSVKMPEEKYGCTSREVEFRKIVISKRDGSAMPNAYNRNAQKGVLSDYFICSKSRAWMAGPGEKCF